MSEIPTENFGKIGYRKLQVETLSLIMDQRLLFKVQFCRFIKKCNWPWRFNKCLRSCFKIEMPRSITFLSILAFMPISVVAIICMRSILNRQYHGPWIMYHSWLNRFRTSSNRFSDGFNKNYFDVYMIERSSTTYKCKHVFEHWKFLNVSLLFHLYDCFSFSPGLKIMIIFWLST